MKTVDLIKFNELEFDIIHSELELSEVRGGKSIVRVVISAIMDIFDSDDGGGSNNNCNCTNNCNG